MYLTIKRWFYENLNTNEFDKPRKLGKWFDFFIMLLISLNIIAVILETDDSIREGAPFFFKYFELFSTVVFSIEYLLRVWSCTLNPKYKGKILGRLKYMVSPMAIIDMLAIAPFYVQLFAGSSGIDLRFVRAIRLFRLFRLFKMGRYTQSIKSVANVFGSKKEELAITLFVVVMLLIFASSLMYLVEHEENGENFPSIPASMWWGIVTLTTVGYGDVFPITTLGKILGALIALLGVGMVAMPAGIIASGFTEEIQRKRDLKKQKEQEDKLAEREKTEGEKVFTIENPNNENEKIQIPKDTIEEIIKYYKNDV